MTVPVYLREFPLVIGSEKSQVLLRGGAMKAEITTNMNKYFGIFIFWDLLQHCPDYGCPYGPLHVRLHRRRKLFQRRWG